MCSGFARANTVGTSVRLRLRHVGLRAQNEARAPRPSCGGFTHALSKRTVPWAPLFFIVLALAPLWCYWWSPSVACAVVSRAPEPWERACATACATLG